MSNKSSLFLFLSFVILSPPVMAQTGNNFYIYQNTQNAGEVDPETGFVYAPPSDPVIPKVKFLKIEPPGSLQEKIERLIHGIKIDGPPEYDHYGYEIRRYMAHAGNEEIFKDRNRLQQELINVQNAKVIFSYWMIELRKSIQEIEATIEAKNESPSIRSSFSYNRGIVDAFQIEAQSWLNSNEEVLKFLVENPAEYKFDKMRLIFQHGESMEAFSSLFATREEARARINKFQPFSLMLY